MKHWLTCLFLLAFGSVQGSVLGLVKVWQPLYLHGSDTDPEIRIVEVPFATAFASPEAEYGAISKPFIPPTDGSWKEKGDVNLASLYKVKVTVDVGTAEDVETWSIEVDATQAKAPEGYPFSVDQVVDAVLTCVKLTHPIKPESDRKVTVKVKKGRKS